MTFCLIHYWNVLQKQKIKKKKPKYFFLPYIAQTHISYYVLPLKIVILGCSAHLKKLCWQNSEGVVLLCTCVWRLVLSHTKCHNFVITVIFSSRVVPFCWALMLFTSLTLSDYLILVICSTIKNNSFL